MLESSYYSILGIEPSASHEEIRKAYKQKALIYHPDKNPNGEAMFKNLNLAYQTLSNSATRSQYDNTLNQSFKQRNRSRSSPNPPTTTDKYDFCSESNKWHNKDYIDPDFILRTMQKDQELQKKKGMDDSQKWYYNVNQKQKAEQESMDHAQAARQASWAEEESKVRQRQERLRALEAELDNEVAATKQRMAQELKPKTYNQKPRSENHGDFPGPWWYSWSSPTKSQEQSETETDHRPNSDNNKPNVNSNNTRLPPINKISPKGLNDLSINSNKPSADSYTNKAADINTNIPRNKPTPAPTPISTIKPSENNTNVSSNTPRKQTDSTTNNNTGNSTAVRHFSTNIVLAKTISKHKIDAKNETHKGNQENSTKPSSNKDNNDLDAEMQILLKRLESIDRKQLQRSLKANAKYPSPEPQPPEIIQTVSPTKAFEKQTQVQEECLNEEHSPTQSVSSHVSFTEPEDDLFVTSQISHEDGFSKIESEINDDNKERHDTQIITNSKIENDQKHEHESNEELVKVSSTVITQVPFGLQNVLEELKEAEDRLDQLLNRLGCPPVRCNSLPTPLPQTPPPNPTYIPSIPSPKIGRAHLQPLANPTSIYIPSVPPPNIIPAHTRSSLNTLQRNLPSLLAPDNKDIKKDSESKEDSKDEICVITPSKNDEKNPQLNSEMSPKIHSPSVPSNPNKSFMKGDNFDLRKEEERMLQRLANLKNRRNDNSGG